MAVIMGPEIALAEAAHGVVASVEEALVDRDLRGPSFVLEAVNDSGSRAQCEQRPMIGMALRGLVTEWNKISEPRGAADEIDVGADGARGEIDRVVQDETAARVHFAVAQIKRLGEPDRTDEIRSVAEQYIVDLSAGYIDVALRKDEAHLVLFRDLARQIQAQASFKFRVTVEIERQRREFRFEPEIGVEEVGIFPENFPFVTALRPFGQSRDGPAVAKSITVAIRHSNDRASIGAIAERQAE